MDYTSNNNTQRMRQSMGPVDQPNWSEASPELKRKMKTELSTLVDNMTI